MSKRDSVSVFFDKEKNTLYFHASGNCGFEDYIGSIEIKSENNHIEISVNPTDKNNPNYQRLYEVSKFPHEGVHDTTYG